MVGCPASSFKLEFPKTDSRKIDRSMVSNFNNYPQKNSFLKSNKPGCPFVLNHNQRSLYSYRKCQVLYEITFIKETQ